MIRGIFKRRKNHLIGRSKPEITITSCKWVGLWLTKHLLRQSKAIGSFRQFNSSDNSFCRFKKIPKIVQCNVHHLQRWFLALLQPQPQVSIQMWGRGRTSTASAAAAATSSEAATKAGSRKSTRTFAEADFSAARFCDVTSGPFTISGYLRSSRPLASEAVSGLRDLKVSSAVVDLGTSCCQSSFQCRTSNCLQAGAVSHVSQVTQNNYSNCS